jgi:peptidase E
MKLLLTSNGLSNPVLKDKFRSSLAKSPAEARVLLLSFPTDLNDSTAIEGCKSEMTELGVQLTAVNLIEGLAREPVDYDAVYVCPSNTFALMQQIKYKSVKDYLVDLVKKGVLYVGAGAGSIIAGPDISIAGWGSEADQNFANFEDATGLELTETAIFPHFRPDLESELAAFRETVSYPVTALADGQAYFEEDGRSEIVG